MSDNDHRDASQEEANFKIVNFTGSRDSEPKKRTKENGNCRSRRGDDERKGEDAEKKMRFLSFLVSTRDRSKFVANCTSWKRTTSVRRWPRDSSNIASMRPPLGRGRQSAKEREREERVARK